MRLLLDTHALVWWLADDPRLSTQVREIVAEQAEVVAVSAASAWEIAIKQALGKLDVPDDLDEQIQAGGFMALPITIADALAAGRLPRHHEDPFDRMLVSQALIHDLTVVTHDERLVAYGISVLPT